MLSFLNRRKKNSDDRSEAIPLSEQEPIISQGLETFRITGDVFMFRDRTKWLLLAPTVLPTDTAFQELATTYNIDAYKFYQWIIERRTKTRMPKLEIMATLSNNIATQRQNIVSQAKNETQQMKMFVQEQEQAIKDILSFKSQLEQLTETDVNLNNLIRSLHLKQNHQKKIYKFEFNLMEFILEYNNNKWARKRRFKNGLGFNKQKITLGPYKHSFIGPTNTRETRGIYIRDDKKELIMAHMEGFEFVSEDGLVQMVTDYPQDMLHSVSTYLWDQDRRTYHYENRNRQVPLINDLSTYKMIFEPKGIKLDKKATKLYQEQFVDNRLRHYKLQQYRHHQIDEVDKIYQNAQGDYSTYIFYRLICDSLKATSLKQIADLRFHDSKDRLIPTIMKELLRISK
ncbi:MAG: hypothetical protein WC004_04940 [Candidatus Absconditabacterales bacterium]